MNKKTILKMGLLLLIGGVVGAVFSLGMAYGAEAVGTPFLNLLSSINENSRYLYPLLIILFFIPAIWYYRKGVDILKKCQEIDDDLLDDYDKKSNKMIGISMLFNGIFMALNFMLLGMTYTINRSIMFVMVMFLVNTLLSSSLEIFIVKNIQKHDPRIKGDPTSFRFHKDYVNSCDEAEQLRIYRAGYNTFQIIRNVTIGFMLFAILTNMILDTGAYAVFMTSGLLLVENIVYSMITMKEEAKI